MSFLDLSPELLENILYELPSRDLVACMLLNKFICTTICGSIRLRYKLVLLRFGAEDNIFSTLPINAKLQSLSDSQQAWIGLNHVRKYRFGSGLWPIGKHVSLANGMLFGSRLSTGHHDMAFLIQLVTYDSELDSPNNVHHQIWRRHGCRRPSPQYFASWIAYTASLYEHGLVAEVISEWTEADAITFKISVYLRHFPSPNSLPQAHKHCGPVCLVPESASKHVYIMDSPYREPYISLQIVGRHLVVIVGPPEHNAASGEDNIFVYDFISDVLLMAFRAVGRTYRSIIFLDENLILLPNAQMGKLDIFRITSQPTFEPAAPLVSLDLPILYGKQFVYGSITCTANPNPLSESSYAEMDRRFSLDPRDSLRSTFHPGRGRFKRAEESVCVFTVCVEKVRCPRDAPRQLAERFTFVVHRSALLEIVAKCEKTSSPADHSRPHASSPPHPWFEFIDLPMDDPLTSRVWEDPTMAHIQEHDDTGEPFWHMPGARTRFSWENWGPRITRWFNDSNLAEGDVTRGWGERCVRLAPRAHSGSGSHPAGVPYHVIDFRRSNCKVARKTTRVLVANRSSAITRNPHESLLDREYGEVVKFYRETIDYVPPNFSFGIEAPTYLLNKVFIRPVISALPYYCRGSAERVKWDRVLIDDQMIVGCRELHPVYSFIEVLFFG